MTECARRRIYVTDVTQMKGIWYPIIRWYACALLRTIDVDDKLRHVSETREKSEFRGASRLNHIWICEIGVTFEIPAKGINFHPNIFHVAEHTFKLIDLFNFLRCTCTFSSNYLTQYKFFINYIYVLFIDFILKRAM